jgi:hypothetical protein
MADPTEVIRQQMEETRGTLSEKLETLESKVTDAVQGAADAVQTVTEAVQETVDSVKGGVQDAAETVKETFDLSGQVARRPWAMFAGSVAVGFVAAKVVGWRGERRAGHTLRAAFQPQPLATPAAPAGLNGRDEGMNWLGWLERSFGPEIEKLKELSIGTTMSLVRDLATQSVPVALETDVKDVFDGFTTKLGGKPLKGPVLPTKPAEHREFAGPHF